MSIYVARGYFVRVILTGSTLLIVQKVIIMILHTVDCKILLLITAIIPYADVVKITKYPTEYQLFINMYIKLHH